jgi:hypothetical protein
MTHCSITCRSLRGRLRRTKQSLNRIRKLLYQTYTLIRRAELFCLILGLGGCFVASLLAMTRLFIKAWGSLWFSRVAETGKGRKGPRGRERGLSHDSQNTGAMKTEINQKPEKNKRENFGFRYSHKIFFLFLLLNHCHVLLNN